MARNKQRGNEALLMKSSGYQNKVTS